MATVYKATNYGLRGDPVTTANGCDITIPFSFDPATLGTAYDLVINDQIYLAPLPAGAIIHQIFLDIPDLDSGTSLTLDLGLVGGGLSVVTNVAVAAALAAFLSAGTGGQAGAADIVPSLNGYVKGSLPYTELTANNILVLTAHAASTGAGAGTTLLTGYVRYSMRSTVF